MRKLKQKNKDILAVCFLGVFLFGLGLTAYFKMKLKHFVNDQVSVVWNINPLPTLTPSLVPTITPTPTLTPEQVAEIKRKQFAEMNAKYGSCRSIPILMYHHVLPAGEAKTMGVASLNVDNGVFRQQMDFLVGKGYQTLSLSEMMSMLSSGSLPNKAVVLTFDDAYRDFYTNVFPILKEKNLKATVFVISQYIGGDKYMLWPQVSEAASSGLVTIGNHTLNHPWLSKLDNAGAINQIVSANNILQQNSGQPVNVFAYPYGNSNDYVKEILKENNFSAAVTTVSGTTQCAGLPYGLQRIRIGGASLASYGL